MPSLRTARISSSSTRGGSQKAGRLPWRTGLLASSSSWTQSSTANTANRTCRSVSATGNGGGNLLQVLRPEQPILPVGEAHLYDYVLFSPVATHNLADQTSALLYSVVLLHLHSHAHACIWRLH